MLMQATSNRSRMYGAAEFIESSTLAVGVSERNGQLFGLIRAFAPLKSLKRLPFNALVMLLYLRGSHRSGSFRRAEGAPGAGKASGNTQEKAEAGGASPPSPPRVTGIPSVFRR